MPSEPVPPSSVRDAEHDELPSRERKALAGPRVVASQRNGLARSNSQSSRSTMRTSSSRGASQLQRAFKAGSDCCSWVGSSYGRHSMPSRLSDSCRWAGVVPSGKLSRYPLLEEGVSPGGRSSAASAATGVCCCRAWWWPPIGVSPLTVTG